MFPPKPANRHDWAERADKALEVARKLPEGPKRTEALETAEMLRQAALMFELFKPKPT